MTKQILFDSYVNCSGRLHTENIKPFNEQEILPLFADFWVDNIILNLLELRNINREDIINISVLRSMLIMDLVTCDYSKKTYLKEKVFNFYSNLLDKFYKTDKFSLERNIHSDINFNDIKDVLFYENKNYDLIELMNKCFIYSYERNGDIFADNTYEILGPFYINKNTIYVNRFFIKGKQYDFFQWSKSYCLGKIDMFGHNDISLKEPNIILLYNGDFYFENFEINFEIKQQNKNLILLTNSRIERYEKLIKNEYLENFRDLVSNINDEEIIKNRNNNLIEKIKF